MTSSTAPTPRSLRRSSGRSSPTSSSRATSARSLATKDHVNLFLATKDHVNLFLYDGALVPDPDGIITGGHNNKAARMISFYEGDRIKARPLTAMLKQIIANNRAADRRKHKTHR